MNFEEKQEVA